MFFRSPNFYFWFAYNSAIAFQGISKMKAVNISVPEALCPSVSI